ncbi:porin [Chthonobacter rhizosphaerae]|uniref:porin n=1 Tax=Chthonobacter rhizosphaerae TaxID=2735553 RepID=UPI0015EF9393|nr:porin [Chthonobacter rhizosphaerae]
MNIKTIMLGTAAGLMTVSAGYAADLPGEPVPAAVDYVKVCDTFGKGFFYIPGTETCLDISGRVRAKADIDFDDDVGFAVDGRVQFDARNGTEYGALRSFLELKTEKTGKGIEVGKAFIQLGYVTVGFAADFFDGFGAVYGDTDRNKFGSTDLLAGVMVDDLGGGFYAGLQAIAGGTALDAGTTDDFEIQGIVGISDQPWGEAAIAASYSDATESFFVKAGAELTVTDELSAAASVAYDDAAEDLFLAVGASYAATDMITAYANFGYTIDSTTGADDTYGVTVGADFAVASGLVLTSEVVYEEAGDEFTGLLQLSRTW